MKTGDGNLIFPTDGLGLASKEETTMFKLANADIAAASLQCSSSSILAVISMQ